MLSIRGSLDNFQPLIRVSIAALDRPMDREECAGLIDTGATRTCVTGRLVARLNLPPRGKLLVATADRHAERRRAYGFSLGIYGDNGHDPTSLHVFDGELAAPLFMDNDNFDVLVGMDIIATGRLIVERMTFALDLPT